MIRFVIVNRKNNASLEGPGLIAHLIEKHGFFGGRENRHRVDPTKAVNVLEAEAAKGGESRHRVDATKAVDVLAVRAAKGGNDLFLVGVVVVLLIAFLIWKSL